MVAQRTNVFPIETKKVLNFGKDYRISSILNLDKQSLDIIKTCQMVKNENDYMIGSFRPDLIIGKNNDNNEYAFQICEINARFALNGAIFGE